MAALGPHVEAGSPLEGPCRLAELPNVWVADILAWTSGVPGHRGVCGGRVIVAVAGDQGCLPRGGPDRDELPQAAPPRGTGRFQEMLLQGCSYAALAPREMLRDSGTTGEMPRSAERGSRWKPGLRSLTEGSLR